MASGVSTSEPSCASAAAGARRARVLALRPEGGILRESRCRVVEVSVVKSLVLHCLCRLQASTLLMKPVNVASKFSRVRAPNNSLSQPSSNSSVKRREVIAIRGPAGSLTSPSRRRVPPASQSSRTRREGMRVRIVVSKSARRKERELVVKQERAAPQLLRRPFFPSVTRRSTNPCPWRENLGGRRIDRVSQIHSCRSLDGEDSLHQLLRRKSPDFEFPIPITYLAQHAGTRSRKARRIRIPGRPNRESANDQLLDNVCTLG